MRLLEGFPEIEPLPKQLPFAASLGLGEFDPDRIRIEKIELPEGAIRVRAPLPDKQALTVPEQEPDVSWLRWVKPW